MGRSTGGRHVRLPERLKAGDQGERSRREIKAGDQGERSRREIKARDQGERSRREKLSGLGRRLEVQGVGATHYSPPPVQEPGSPQRELRREMTNWHVNPTAAATATAGAAALAVAWEAWEVRAAASAASAGAAARDEEEMKVA